MSYVSPIPVYENPPAGCKSACQGAFFCKNGRAGGSCKPCRTLGDGGDYNDRGRCCGVRKTRPAHSPVFDYPGAPGTGRTPDAQAAAGENRIPAGAANKAKGKQKESMEKGTLSGVKLIVSGVVGSITSWLGSLAYPVYVLVFLNVTDYITGIVAAKYRGQKRSSQVGLRGIAKKVCMLLLIFLGWVVDWLLAYAAGTIGLAYQSKFVVAAVVAVWLICNELISILENIGDIGVSLPPVLTRMVRWIKCESETPGQCPGAADDAPQTEAAPPQEVRAEQKEAGEESRQSDEKGGRT